MFSYGDNICPIGGEISYVEGAAACSIHSNPNEVDNDSCDDKDVPYL